MKLLMKKAVSINFSGCGKQKKRDFSATKVAAAVFGKFYFFISKNILKILYSYRNINKILNNFKYYKKCNIHILKM